MKLYMYLRRSRSFCRKINIILNNLNTEFRKELFRLSVTKIVQKKIIYKVNLDFLKHNQVTFGTKEYVYKKKVCSIFPVIIYRDTKATF